MQGLQKQIGLRLRLLREEKGMSQEALAAACDLHRTYIGLIERGERSLSVPTIETIAKTLGVPPSRLFEGTEVSSAPVPSKPGKKATTTLDLGAHIRTIRQILIDAGLVDAERYERILKTQDKKTQDKPLKS